MEFEKKLQEIRNHKTVQRILSYLNADSTQFDQTKENLKLKSGTEPTDNDVILEIIETGRISPFQKPRYVVYSEIRSFTREIFSNPLVIYEML